jgi:ubiquinone biosynthesis monooxygenase Coq7
MSKLIDKYIISFDSVIKMIINPDLNSVRPNPGFTNDNQAEWSFSQLKESQGQMRINHTGEICAQALYAGHRSTDADNKINQWLEDAKNEEKDHLIWCHQRLLELKTKPSIFNPFFYSASYLIARILSSCNQEWNLSFIKETEFLVGHHLKEQENLLNHDRRSLEIIKQMQIDEQKHHDTAEYYGGISFSPNIKKLMSCMAHAMKKIVYFI